MDAVATGRFERLGRGRGAGSSIARIGFRASAWFPLIVLPGASFLYRDMLPAWQFMWLLAVAVYVGLKWLTFADAAIATRKSSRQPFGRSLCYLLLWPGMDARTFLASDRFAAPPRPSEWWWAIGKTVAGAAFVATAAWLVNSSPLIAAWIGMIGMVLALHFGLFHLLSNTWRTAGVDAPPIMASPLVAKSLAEFWGGRWNRAFRDVAHRFVFRPLVNRWGAAVATLAVFAVSGVVHDLVISAPTRGGYGLPTLYFLLQGVAVLFERTQVARQLGLGRGWRGRAFCALVTVAPIGWLFHGPFVERIVVPMLLALAGG